MSVCRSTRLRPLRHSQRGRSEIILLVSVPAEEALISKLTPVSRPQVVRGKEGERDGEAEAADYEVDDAQKVVPSTHPRIGAQHYHLADIQSRGSGQHWKHSALLCGPALLCELDKKP